MRKCIQHVLFILSVVLCASIASGKAAYHGKAAMIEDAEVIAVVEITAVEKVSTKANGWTYAQKATAKVEKVLKGNVPEKVALYGDEGFICARCHFEVGRYLVFLKRDGTLLAGNNWHLSVCKINGDKVDWYKDGNGIEQVATPLDDVLKEIPAILAQPPKPESKAK